MSNQYVVQAQVALKEKGLYTGLIDGEFGKGSLGAVMQLLSNAADAVEILDSSKTSADAPKLANYILSEMSLQRLKGVHPDLIKVVKRAIQITEMDFAVNEGLRTIEQQRKYVNAGKSQTMKSNHLTGRAVDIVPTPDGGAVSWDWQHYYPMAKAMQRAAEEVNVRIKWGGCWEVINGKGGDPKTWVDAYGARKRAAGQKAFTDGPHFELA